MTDFKVSSVNQEILLILWNSNFHRCVHMNLPPVPIQSQISPVHFLLTSFFKIHFNIILSMYKSSRQSISFSFDHQTPVGPSPVPCTWHACPSHSSLFHQTDNTAWGDKILEFLIMQFSPVSCYVLLMLDRPTKFSRSECRTKSQYEDW